MADTDLVNVLERIAVALEKSNELVEGLRVFHEKNLENNIKWTDSNMRYDEIMEEERMNKALPLMDKLIKRALAKLKEKS